MRMSLKKEVAAILSVCIFAGLFVLYLFRPSVNFLNWGKGGELSKQVNKLPSQNYSDCEAFKRNFQENYWSKLNLKSLDIPAAVKTKASSIEVKSSKVFVKNAAVHYLYVAPIKPKADGISVLLLHGQAYSSATWENIGTIRVLGSLGYHTVAVDLPGFGKSPSVRVEDKVAFMRDLLGALQIKKPVIVSPSMSGSFSLPYIISERSKVAGFVPVSPVGTRLLEGNTCGSSKQTCSVVMDETCRSLQTYIKNQDSLNLCCMQLPVMVVFGEHDRGPSSARLCHFPWSRGVQIPKGNHAAYLSNPDLWHKILYNFLVQVETIDLCR